MSNISEEAPNFLRDALNSYSNYINPQKQEVQKRALRWLQTCIANLEDKTILPNFAKKWREGSTLETTSTLSLDLLGSSYKGEKSINGHQEEALAFLQETIPLTLQEEFKKHWDIKTKLEVSNPEGTPFKVTNSDLATLQAADSAGNGQAWYQVPKGTIYYLLASEVQGEQCLVVLDEEISPQPNNTWYVDSADIKISNV